MPDVPAAVDLEERPCPLGCDASDREVITGFDRISDVPGRYAVVECQGCGLMRTNPRPTAATIGAYYPDDYGPYQSTTGAPQRAQRAGLVRLGRRLLQLDSRQMPPITPGRLLELGCASGSFLEEMRQAGWDAEGVEFSPSAASVARERGFRVQTGAIEEAEGPSQPYDAIVAWMVLEHLHQPTQVLRRLREWIAPEGYFVFSVPDGSAMERRLFGNAWHAWHLPNHLYHYTPKTLARLLDATGWQIEKIYWQRNPGNLLRSLQNVAKDRGLTTLATLCGQMAEAPRYSKLRISLGWLLAVTRQSGRIEIWARPKR